MRIYDEYYYVGAREAHKEFKNVRKMIVAIFKIVRFFCRVIKYYRASKGTTRNLL